VFADQAQSKTNRAAAKPFWLPVGMIASSRSAGLVSSSIRNHTSSLQAVLVRTTVNRQCSPLSLASNQNVLLYLAVLCSCEMEAVVFALSPKVKGKGGVVRALCSPSVPGADLEPAIMCRIDYSRLVQAVTSAAQQVFHCLHNCLGYETDVTW